MNGTIAVAIPVYNRANWIAKTLDHILAQTVPVDEIVVCDDGSTDNLEEALEPYQNKISLIRISNSGPAIARRTAIQKSRGDWIALCDSDDYWFPEHIEKFVDARNHFPDLELYFSNFRPSNQPDTTKFMTAPEGWLTRLTGVYCCDNQEIQKCRPALLTSLLEFQACFPSCMIFKRSLYEKVGGIHSKVSRWGAEDFHLTARMAAISESVINIGETVTINKHDSNFSSEYINNLNGEVKILTDILDSKLVPNQYFAAIEGYLEEQKFRLFRSYYWSSNFEDALTIARTLHKKKFTIRDWLRFARASFARVPI